MITDKEVELGSLRQLKRLTKGRKVVERIDISEMRATSWQN